MQNSTKIGSDNALEDYFLDLLVNKHIIDHEIQDLLDVIEKSILHPDYQILIKRILFGNKNVYMENWGTLASSLEDIIKSIDIRGTNIKDYGIVLRMMISVIEEVFDVGDEYFHDFLICEEKEDIEHRLILLMKRILDYVEAGLGDILQNTKNLDTPVDGYQKDEYIVIKTALEKYPTEIMKSQKIGIEKLKVEVDSVALKIQTRKKNLRRLGA